MIIRQQLLPLLVRLGQMAGIVGGADVTVDADDLSFFAYTAYIT